MTTRLLALPTIIVALVVLTACSGPEALPYADEPPQAPPPRAKEVGPPKPWAELLVGTWKGIKMKGVPVPPELDIRFEFMEGGKFSLIVRDPKNGHQVSSGTYILDGNAIRFTSQANANGPGASWTITIESLTNEELNTVSGPVNERQRYMYKRIKTHE